ncbi:MAG: hypothetical protein HYV97_20140 [Bdellovibrio sp.]|nr:hypothetical protein [Bdellovibrio sp.]
MEKSKFANLANNNSEKEDVCKKKRLGLALDTLSELLNIEFGSLTVHFHKGRWCPKVEIQKNVLSEINEA